MKVKERKILYKNVIFPFSRRINTYLDNRSRNGYAPALKAVSLFHTYSVPFSWVSIWLIFSCR